MFYDKSKYNKFKEKCKIYSFNKILLVIGIVIIILSEILLW